MSNFKSRFDEQATLSIKALGDKADEFRSSFYNVDYNYVRRLIERISASLLKIDQGKFNHPVFLAGRGQGLPDKALSIVTSMPSAINDSGINHFINNVLPDLVEVDEGLAKAIGVNEIRSAEIKSSQLRAIERYLDWSKSAYGQIVTSRTSVKDNSDEIKGIQTEIAAIAESARLDGKKLKEVRATALRLSSGTKTSPALSVIIKEAQGKLEEIEGQRSGAENIHSELEKLRSSIEVAETASNEALSRLEGHDRRASDILNNATQAGLAGAYKLEREKLAKQQMYFAGAFYGIIALVILYAAIFIVPIASEIILKNSSANVTVQESGLLLFVRILIVLPALWALVFTNKRFIYLETLQMDYAAKAVTALAYSGYRDEMNDDKGLSSRLRDGLVTRFVEHPSRLLGDKVESSLSITESNGSKVISESRSPDAVPLGLSESSVVGVDSHLPDAQP